MFESQIIVNSDWVQSYLSFVYKGGSIEGIKKCEG